ncbi:carbohydrate sulfotransferase 8 isoform X2 [Callorhinchus milii]|uniref:carbohydrate sulfotransferase 8 isoform X2 n=1 Tax=Callorhinchus milii TaxID=7868 RepID=UPI001C3FE724|nr:carbohydrate sulfotransferase 8 isoform X2 [Callorhinchus milii]
MLWGQAAGHCPHSGDTMAATRVTCLFIFVLLFGAFGLLVFSRLQDLSHILPPQTGVLVGVKVRHIRKASGRWIPPGGKGAVALTRQPWPLHLSWPELNTTSLRQRIPGSSLEKGERERELKPHTRPGDREWSPGPGPSLPRRPHRRRRKLLNEQEKMPEAEEQRRLQEVQLSRRRLVQQMCLRVQGQNLGVGRSLGLGRSHLSRVYVEDRHGLLYCEVPKAGCSNWKRVLMVLSGQASDPDHIRHQAVHYSNALRRLDSFDRAGVEHRLQTYTKALFVREPFQRLVSAFRDKFEHPNAYYHPVFGRAIISKYRPNATQEALVSGSGVTFSEFARYLLDGGRPVGMDIHWEGYGRLCSPCLIDYDFIGKFETMDEDAAYLLRLLAAPGNLTFPRNKDRHPGDKRTGPELTHHYFSRLSAAQRQGLYQLYSTDYLMFNYSTPFSNNNLHLYSTPHAG